MNGNRVFNVTDYIITQTYASHCASGAYARGVDLVSQKDNRYIQSDIVAHSDGVVLYAGNGDGYGNAVWILHADNVVTGYGHMRELKVHTGDNVLKGQPIGVIGNTGNSTGIHLHFEVRKYTKPYKVEASDFWGTDSFMNTDKFTWLDATPYINAELPNEHYYRVQVGAYRLKVNAIIMQKKLIADGYKPICKFYGNMYHIQVGAFKNKGLAQDLSYELEKKGYDTYITEENGIDVTL